MRITFAHTKGGVGKTTSAMMIAAAAARKGRDVEVLDADKQGSASRWAEVAQQRGNPLPFTVQHVSAKNLRSLSSNSNKLQIIDTPPGDAAAIQAAVDIADLIVVPTGAAPLDIDRVWPTLDALHGRPVGVLLTGVLINTRLYAETRRLFEDQGVPTFYHAVPQREDIKAAFGTNPIRFHGYEDIYQEISEIEEL